MGARRPGCEECGRVELDEIGRLIWSLFCLYSESLGVVSGPGGFTINVLTLNLLVHEYGFPDKLLMLRCIQSIAREAMKQELKQTDGQRS